MMNVTQPAKLHNSLQAITQVWKDQIICFSPQGEGYNAYLVDSRDGSTINYIQASCDQLRHFATNYNSLLIKIKEQYYGYLKEAVLNTVKYEATRRAFKKQHEWIQESYKSLIEQKKLNAQQQSLEINKLKVILQDQKQEITNIKNTYRGQLAAIQAEAILKQKEIEIAQKNREIAQLNQQLQKCDREIKSLKSELNQGLSELKQKYKWLIGQFIQEHTNKQYQNYQNKSLQACLNIFRKAQEKFYSIQDGNQFVQQELNLSNNLKVLPIRSS
jgi:hypothetical protein